jgi:hypothetical protein
MLRIPQHRLQSNNPDSYRVKAVGNNTRKTYAASLFLGIISKGQFYIKSLWLNFHVVFNLFITTFFEDPSTVLQSLASNNHSLNISTLRELQKKTVP